MMTDVLSRYDQLRKASRDVNARIVETLTGEEMTSAGERLGIVRDGVLIFSSEDDTNVLMDYAIHRLGTRPSPAERFYAELSARLDGAERAWAEATTRACFRILRLGPRAGPAQTETQDLLTGERLLLVDRGVADSGAPGQALAGYVLDFPGFVVTSGGAIAMPEAVPDVLLAMLREQGFPVGTPAMVELPPERLDALAASVTGVLLAVRGADNDADDLLEDMARDAQRRSPVRSRLQRRPARNAPCPCGSGRKYKACCGKGS